MPSERLRHGRRSRSSRSGHRRRVSVSPMPRREQSRPQNTATRSKAPPPAVPPKLTINVRPDQIKIEVYDTATLSDPHVQSMFQAISTRAQSAPSAPAQPIGKVCVQRRQHCQCGHKGSLQIFLLFLLLHVPNMCTRWMILFLSPGQHGVSLGKSGKTDLRTRA